MARLFRETREVGGADPIDSRLGFRAPTRLDILLRRRPALGLAPAAAPALVFLPLGFLLGPAALNVLSGTVLAHLDTVVSVALAALGVFVGLALDLRGGTDLRPLAAASGQASLTVVVVFGATSFLLSAWGLPVDVGVLAVAMVLGICASASSAGAAETSDDAARRAATRIADLDDILPILAGGVLLASLRGPGAVEALELTGLTIAVGVAIGTAGWLLFERAAGEAERAAFVLGTILLLGGGTAYLGLSPLLAGMSAGLLWVLAPGEADHVIRQDLGRLQHPLVVLLLLTAGASVVLSAQALWLLVPFVLFRLAGKLVGGWLASQVSGEILPSDLVAYLMQPGVLGIAFALNFQQVVASTTGAAVMSAVAVGSLISEGLALVVLPADDRQ